MTESTGLRIVSEAVDEIEQKVASDKAAIEAAKVASDEIKAAASQGKAVVQAAVTATAETAEVTSAKVESALDAVKPASTPPVAASTADTKPSAPTAISTADNKAAPTNTIPAPTNSSPSDVAPTTAKPSAPVAITAATATPAAASAGSKPAVIPTGEAATSGRGDTEATLGTIRKRITELCTNPECGKMAVTGAAAVVVLFAMFKCLLSGDDEDEGAEKDDDVSVSGGLSELKSRYINYARSSL